jgi:hypothetical protein
LKAVPLRGQQHNVSELSLAVAIRHKAKRRFSVRQNLLTTGRSLLAGVCITQVRLSQPTLQVKLNSTPVLMQSSASNVDNIQRNSRLTNLKEMNQFWAQTNTHSIRILPLSFRIQTNLLGKSREANHLSVGLRSR